MATTAVSKLFSVEGLVFVITGGGSGIGEWTATALDANGAAKVFILGRRQASLDRVAAQAANKSIVPIQCDVTSADDLSRAVAEVQKYTAYVNCVIANAGTLGDVPLVSRPYKEGSAAEVVKLLRDGHKNDVRVMDTNVTSVYSTFTAFLDLLLASNSAVASAYYHQHIQSQFIVVGSISAMHHHGRTGYMYNASKAGVLHLAKCLSNDFASLGVRVNCIAPGTFVTEINEQYFPDPVAVSRPGGMAKEYIPAGRAGTPEDIVATVIYLTSRAGAFVNGALTVVDGGESTLSPFY